MIAVTRQPPEWPRVVDRGDVEKRSHSGHCTERSPPPFPMPWRKPPPPGFRDELRVGISQLYDERQASPAEVSTNAVRGGMRAVGSPNRQRGSTNRPAQQSHSRLTVRDCYRPRAVVRASTIRTVDCHRMPGLKTPSRGQVTRIPSTHRKVRRAGRAPAPKYR